jgi:hypothetical protein
VNVFLRAALAYAEYGYEVVPLHGKAPMTARGFYDATTDAGQIKVWWEAFPDANIGCRPPDNTIVLDIDPRNGGTLAALGDYPQTRTAQTGSGGWHVWFAATGRFRGTLTGAEGVDIKTGSGLVVMPPSVHPVTGSRYRWIVPGPVAPLPRHLVERVVKPPRKPVRLGNSRITDKQIDGIITKMENTVVERNNMLHWCACRLFESGAPVEAFVRLELAAAATGLDDDEIARTVESAGRQVTR